MFNLRIIPKFLRQSLVYSEKISSCRFCTNESSSDKQNQYKSRNNDPKELIMHGSFENLSEKNRKTYLEMVKVYESKGVQRRNHVEFIYAALRNMEAFGVHRDITVYKALMNVMPKGKFIPQNIFQSEFMHYPKQQQAIIDLLEQMEDNGVIPDHEMQDILLNTFGRRGHPVLKYQRMLYWMPKFRNASPWALPNPVPDDTFKLAKMAVERMCTVDLTTKVQVYSSKDVESSIDDTWIVSGMSPEQSKLLEKVKKNQSLNIEGPYLIWLRNKSVNYFTLRSDPEPPKEERSSGGPDIDDVGDLQFDPLSLTIKTKVSTKKSVHIQDDGTIYAICATGTSTKDSLLSWIRLLERDNNPALANIPILFKFKSHVANQLVPTTS